MKKAIKTKWVKALTSGKYKQTDSVLQSEGKFCCLGVLCDLYAKEKKIKDFWEGDGARCIENIKDNGDVLPTKVARWAGLMDGKVALEEGDPQVDYKGEKTCLSVLNDREGKTFKAIAKLIDKSL